MASSSGSTNLNFFTTVFSRSEIVSSTVSSINVTNINNGALLFSTPITLSPQQITFNIQTVATNLNTDLTTNLFDNFTSSTNSTTRDKSGSFMPKWQIILIASLAAVCVVGIILLILIWQLCGKKKPVRDVEGGGQNKQQQSSSTSSSCCPCLRKSNKSTAGVAPGAGNNNPPGAVIHAGQNDFNRLNLAKQPPLPPIPGAGGEPKLAHQHQQQYAVPPRNDHNDTPLHQFSVNNNNYNNNNNNLQQRRQPHGRLAPLFKNSDEHAMMDHHANNSSNGNSYSFHGGQQSFSLRGVPVIPVPQDKRRPLPTPPNLD